MRIGNRIFTIMAAVVLLAVAIPVTINVTNLASADSVVDRIKIDARECDSCPILKPNQVAYNPDNKNMYITTLNSNSGTVLVFNTERNTVVNQISTGSQANYISYNPEHEKIYVGHAGGSSVTVIDTQTDTKIGDITVGNNPQQIAFSEFNGNMYVANKGSNSVSVIDGNSDSVVKTIPVGINPFGVVYNSNNQEVYVAADGGLTRNSVTIIDSTTNKVIKTIVDTRGGIVFLGLQGIVFSPADNFVYLADSDSVYYLDSSSDTIVTQNLVRTGVNWIYNPDNNLLYYDNAGILGCNLLAYNPNTAVSSQMNICVDSPLSGTLRGIAFNSDNHYLYVAESTAPQIIIVSTSQSGPGNPFPSLDGLLGSCNNVNIQGQINTGNNVISQDGNADEDDEDDEDENGSNDGILQSQSSSQDSQCVS